MLQGEKMNLNLKILGHGIGLGSMLLWILIFIKAHLDNDYIVTVHLNDFSEAYLETFVLIVGVIILVYDFVSAVIEKGREVKKMKCYICGRTVRRGVIRNQQLVCVECDY